MGPREKGTTTMYRARLGIRPGIWLSIAALLAAAWAASPAMALDADTPGHSGWSLLNLPVGVTSISKEVYRIHMIAFWVCVWIGVIVFGVMIDQIITPNTMTPTHSSTSRSLASSGAGSTSTSAKG